MKCQKCSEHEATTHVKRIINGKAEEYYLCQECATQMGYGNIFAGIPFPLESFLGNYLVDGSAKTAAPKTKNAVPFAAARFRTLLQAEKSAVRSATPNFIKICFRHCKEFTAKPVTSAKFRRPRGQKPCSASSLTI